MSEIRINSDVVMRPVAQLLPYARNARTHTPEQIAQIAASMREFGFTNPILIDEHEEIIAGHGRVMAAQQLAMTECPTIQLSYLTDAQKKAYRLADNKLALNANWDLELLRTELSDLISQNYDPSFTGFMEMEIDALISPETNVNDEWLGMPDQLRRDVKPFLSLMVHFRNVDDVHRFAALIKQPVNPSARRVAYVWFPAQPNATLTVEDVIGPNGS